MKRAFRDAFCTPGLKEEAAAVRQERRAVDFHFLAAGIGPHDRCRLSATVGDAIQPAVAPGEQDHAVTAPRHHRGPVLSAMVSGVPPTMSTFFNLLAGPRVDEGHETTVGRPERLRARLPCRRAAALSTLSRSRTNSRFPSIRARHEREALAVGRDGDVSWKAWERYPSGG